MKIKCEVRFVKESKSGCHAYNMHVQTERIMVTGTHATQQRGAASTLLPPCPPPSVS